MGTIMFQTFTSNKSRTAYYTIANNKDKQIYIQLLITD